VLSHFRHAIDDAKRRARHRQDDMQTLRNRAHDILGWMLVTTVMHGYDNKEAPAVRAWLNGVAFYVPIGRSVCLEVLSATWLKRGARFAVEAGRRPYGRDEINPEGTRLGEIGFDDPNKIRQGAVVNEVWRLIYQKIDAHTAPLVVDDETKERLRTRLRIQLNEYRRRLRLVVDPSDLRDPLAMPAALEAIGREIPWLHLMVISPGNAAHKAIFLMPAGQLAGEIEECLTAIESLLSPSD
jgi:hypothetical protein